MRKTLSTRRPASLQSLTDAVDAAMAQLAGAEAGCAEAVLRDSGVVAARTALRRRGGVAVLADADAVSGGVLCAA
ncbi:hypothetical protein [Pseudooceanicola sp. 200-1SW]|uniref:hypothetical protein n=1 Tax=Pseudooceanicola sp. 200-1SW TaxID=3425949 RepID=UPI003D7F456D